MGFDQGHIVLDRHGSYSTGETIHGKLVFDQDKVKTFRGLYIQFKGTCEVHWTTTRSSSSNGRSSSRTVHHRAHETYFKERIYLMGSENGEVNLQPGHHEFPFQFLIPQHCPSSFKGKHGHIDYELKCVVDRPWKFDQEKKLAVEVVAVKDLNIHHCGEPVTFQFNENYCCWCVSSGTCDAEVRLPYRGYVPGQTINLQVNCNNKSNVDINHIKLELKEDVTFRATSSPGTRSINHTIAKIKKGPVPGNSTRNWTVEMEIPLIDVRNVDTCKYIDVDYEFLVKLSVSGCHSNASNSSPIIIGHIPLRESERPQQNQIQNYEFIPLKSPAASPFPANCNKNSPYPGANSPYPGANPSPMPKPPKMNPSPMGSPYPPNAPPPENPDTPYKDRDSLYPGNSRFPMPNLPYQRPNSPLPGENPPAYSPDHRVNLSDAGVKPPYPLDEGANAFPMPKPPTMNTSPAGSPYPLTLPSPPSGSPNKGSLYPGRLFPMTNLPYHRGNSPLPGANLPTSSPNPGAKLLKSGVNSPYAGVKSSPYYTNATPPSPYPIPPPPSSNTTPTSMNKPEIENEDSLPLLPLGGSPYPPDSSPYPNASAPEPSTPDALTSPPLHNHEHK